MVDERDVRGLRQARCELTKHGIDIARADLQLRKGVLTVRGQVAKMPGSPIEDLKLEMDHMMRLLRQRPEIREVIVDCAYLA